MTFRPFPDTLHHLMGTFPEETWETLSHRKQVCFIYLKWSIRPMDAELRNILVDKVKEWRVKEPNRIGGKRSLLERMVRKRLFKLQRREKTVAKNHEGYCKSVELQKENKTGQFTEEMQAFRKSSANGERGAAARRRNAKGLDWVVYAPDGSVFEINNLRAFCREWGLDWSHLSRTSLYPNYTYRGWSARKKNPFIDLPDFT